MAIEIDAVMQVITKTLIEATKAAVEAYMVERRDETIRHRSEEAGVRPNLGGLSPTFNFTKEVKNTCQT